MADNALLKFQGDLLEGTQLEEVVQEDGVYLKAPQAPGLGLKLAPELAAKTRLA